LLEKAGHHAIVAEDGNLGVEACMREKPDLVLMDLIMPNLNGFQAMRKLSTDPATKHIPIVILSTKNLTTDKIWGMRQGAKAYLTKPFKELIDTINLNLAAGVR
jgi:twitching motility two-component system response regulator PilH